MTAVVILPGLDGTGALLGAFCAAIEELGVGARALAYPADRALAYGELEPLVRAQLPSQGAFVLLGESFSGPLAIRIAANPPPGLVGLVLSTTFARAPVPVLSAFSPFVRFAPARLPMPVLAWALLGPWSRREIRLGLDAALRSVSPSALRARAADALRVDVSGLLPSIRVPVLQLAAANDRLLAPSTAAALSAGLPSCRTVTVAGPHLLLQTAVSECAREVAAFALGLGTGSSSGPAPIHGAA